MGIKGIKSSLPQPLPTGTPIRTPEVMPKALPWSPQKSNLVALTAATSMNKSPPGVQGNGMSRLIQTGKSYLVTLLLSLTAASYILAANSFEYHVVPKEPKLEKNLIVQEYEKPSDLENKLYQ